MTWDYQTISSPELLLCALDTLTRKAQVSVSTTFKLWLFHITAGIEALGLSEWKSFLEEFKKKKPTKKPHLKLEGGRYSYYKVLTFVGSTAQILFTKRQSPVWESSPPAFCCFF